MNHRYSLKSSRRKEEGDLRQRTWIRGEHRLRILQDLLRPRFSGVRPICEEFEVSVELRFLGRSELLLGELEANGTTNERINQKVSAYN